MLGWEAVSGGVAMLWGFFDESGEHNRETGHLVKLGLGGCWADAAEWHAFSLAWCDVLSRFSIRAFHMTDFEANRGEFSGWEDRQKDKRTLLKRLLDVMVEHITEYAGFWAYTPNGNADFKRVYEINLRNLLIDFRHKGDASIVIARHNDFGPDKIAAIVCATERLFAGEDRRIATWTIGDPERFSPLQAADIVAYEISRWDRDGEWQRPMRYPMRRLRERMASGFAIF